MEPISTHHVANTRFEELSSDLASESESSQNYEELKLAVKYAGINFDEAVAKVSKDATDPNNNLELLVATGELKAAVGVLTAYIDSIIKKLNTQIIKNI